MVARWVYRLNPKIAALDGQVVGAAWWLCSLCRSVSFGYYPEMTPSNERSLFAVPCPVASQAGTIFTNTTASSTHCEHCERKVAILAGKSLLEIAAFMRANPGSCIVVGGKLGQKRGEEFG